MKFAYHMLRYGSPVIELYDSLDIAISQAAADIEYNRACPVEIKHGDAVVADKDAIWKEYERIYDGPITPSPLPPS